MNAVTSANGWHAHKITFVVYFGEQCFPISANKNKTGSKQLATGSYFVSTEHRLSKAFGSHLFSIWSYEKHNIDFLGTGVLCVENPSKEQNL